jgi:hypothetical protein
VSNWQLFSDFVRAELSAGGPDPQIALIVDLAEGNTDQEKVWLAGCYCAVHCIPSAYLTWRHWRPDQAYFNSDGMKTWLEVNWKALPVRPEMKSHRMLEKRTRCLKDFAQFALEWSPSRAAMSYDELWKLSQNNVKYYGRYMAIKYLEFLRRLVAPHLEMPDMRAKGAWSPRKALQLLFPEANHNPYDNSYRSVKDADWMVDQVVTRFSEEGITVNKFQLQVLLCEFKEALAGGFYPGGTHDEELDYMAISAKGFDPYLFGPIYHSRRRLFSEELLGEVGGWNGIRKEKFQVFRGAATQGV